MMHIVESIIFILFYGAVLASVTNYKTTKAYNKGYEAGKKVASHKLRAFTTETYEQAFLGQASIQAYKEGLLFNAEEEKRKKSGGFITYLLTGKNSDRYKRHYSKPEPLHPKEIDNWYQFHVKDDEGRY